MIFNKEMQEALEADGKKLRELTGEDHGPYFILEKKMADDIWMAALVLDADQSWLDDPLTGFTSFDEARDKATQKWTKLENGESIAIYKCFQILTIKDCNLRECHDDPSTSY